MALRKIAQLGHPVLRQTAKEVPEAEINSPKIQALIVDLIETLAEHDGVGLAAPQIHEPLRIFCVDPGKDASRKDKGTAGPLVFINPKVTSRSREEEVDWEGCLSIPDLWGRVPRAKELTTKGLGRKGEPFEIKTAGFLARKIQHELDHLDGILFPDRMTDLSTLANTFAFRRYWYPKFPGATAR